MRRAPAPSTAAAALAAGALSILGACANMKSPADKPVGPPPSYAVIAEAQNRRAARLDRIWARAVVVLTYIDEDDRRRTEQGEGHLQIRRPGGIGVDVGKLGETYYWLGADDERFWFFDLTEEDVVFLGRHENVGRPCARSLGLPAEPLDLVRLLGVTPIPAPGATDAAPPEVRWSEDGRSVLVDSQFAGAYERIWLDPETLLPSRIELRRSPDGPPAVYAILEEYERVSLRGVGGFFPFAPSRVEVHDPETDTEITLHLSELNDGKARNRLSDAVFDFPTLVDAFGPDRLVILDEDCPDPARP